MSEQPVNVGVPLALADPEKELLQEELAGLIAALPPQRAAPYQALADAARGQSIPASQVPLLESVLVLILGSGRVRHAHRAEGERILQSLYSRTPTGQAATQELTQVNTALAVLKGHPLSQIQVSSRLPGHYSISIDTDTLHLQLTADARGLRIEKAAV